MSKKAGWYETHEACPMMIVDCEFMSLFVIVVESQRCLRFPIRRTVARYYLFPLSTFRSWV
jgi:hypothetical protein